GEVQADGRIKEGRILLKEGTLLREEDLEALVGGGLGFIRLDLTEVGIHREVEYQFVFQYELRVQASVDLGRLGGEIGKVGVALVHEAAGGKHRVGDELHVAPGGDMFEPVEMPFLREAAMDLMGDARPGVALIPPGRIAL